MTTVHKVLDWHGQNAEELARQLAPLPAGRYVLVPENDFVADDALTPDEEDGLLAAIASLDRGEGQPADEVFAAMRARIAAGR